LQGLKGRPWTLALAGQTLAAGGEDGKIVLWELSQFAR
jgi:hypothetical protein